MQMDKKHRTWHNKRIGSKVLLCDCEGFIFFYLDNG